MDTTYAFPKVKQPTYNKEEQKAIAALKELESFVAKQKVEEVKRAINQLNAKEAFYQESLEEIILYCKIRLVNAGKTTKTNI